jgi:hypothetical protein
MSGTFHIISAVVIGSHALDIPHWPGYTVSTGRRDTSAGIANRLWARRPRNWGSIPGGGQKHFSSPKGPDQPWGQPSLLYNGHRGCFSEGKAAEAWS